jgi:VWFA-related protein
MQTRSKIVLLSRLSGLLVAATFLLLTLANQTRAQQPDDVVRISTELVQTDVNVVDKRGRFVDGIKPEDFQLTLDGKPQKILFLERVATGTRTEASQLSTIGRSTKVVDFPSTAMDVSDRVRTIFFFVDDTHLSAEGIVRARKALIDFVDHQMRQNDQVAILSSSGQIGFLQQLTDNKTVLTTAISRLTTKRNSEPNTGKTRISEYMASQVLNNGDKALFAYLIESIKLEQQMGAGNRHGDHRTSSSYSADPYLRNRLRQIEGQGKLSAKATLGSLQGLLASTANLTGRKLLFVLSDGFLMNPQDTDLFTSMRDITDGAAKTGTVIYSVDLRDTSSMSSIDVSINDAVDFSGRTSGIAMSERTANREPLQTMADETGGRVLLNPNSITEGITQALEETADYYLLAWRPDGIEQREGKQRLSVVVRNHPDWRVRVRRKFYSAPVQTKAASKTEPRKAGSPSDQSKNPPLEAALGSLYPRRQAPLSLYAGYVGSNDLSTSTLKLSMQIDPQLFSSQLESTKRKAELDVLGAAVDDRGIISTFKQVLTITPESLNAGAPVVWHQQLTVPSGLYQVRVAVRERDTGWTGSAMQWLVVPEVSRKVLQLSSLFVASRQESSGQTLSSGPQPIKISVDRKFHPNSILRFQTYVYPATPPQDAEIEIQAEVLRNGMRILNLPATRVPNNRVANSTGLPYWSEISLKQLVAGRYVLMATAVDRKTQASTSQQVSFTIE